MLENMQINQHEIWDSEISVAEDSGLQGYNSVSMDKYFPMFQSTIQPSSSGSGQFDPE